MLKLKNKTKQNTHTDAQEIATLALGRFAGERDEVRAGMVGYCVRDLDKYLTHLTSLSPSPSLSLTDLLSLSSFLALSLTE